LGALQVKVIDFAVATLARSSKRVRGKPSYQALDMHNDEEHDSFLADKFAIGVVAFTMATHSYPWLSTKSTILVLLILFQIGLWNSSKECLPLIRKNA